MTDPAPTANKGAIGPLTARTVRGLRTQVGWIAGLNVLALARGILLRRWFLPAELGLLDTALLPVSIANTFSQLGTRQALVRHRERFREVSGTALVLDFLVTSVAFLALVLLAPALASVFHQPELTLWIRVLAVTVYASTLGLPAAAWDQELRFGVAKLPRAVGTVTTVVVSGAALFVGQAGATSLLWGAVAGFAAENGLLWLLAPVRPRPSWNRADAAELARFTAPLLAGALASYVVFEGDDLMVRWLGDSAGLAQYKTAFEWPFYLTSLVAITSGVLYPALIRAEDSRSRLRAFHVANRYIAALTLPAGAAMVVFAQPLIVQLYGPEWLPAVAMLQVFAVAFALRTSTGYNWHLVPMARGDTRPLLWVSAGSAVLTVALGLPLIARYGGMGGAWTNALVALLWAVPARLWVIRREVSPRATLAALPRPGAAAVAAALVAAVLPLPATLPALVVRVVVFGTLYTAMLATLDRRLVVDGLALARAALGAGDAS